MPTILPLLVLTLSCNQADPDSGEATPPPPDTATDTDDTTRDTGDTDEDTAPPVTDADGDGYDAAPWGDDCDDADPTVNPGATETWYDGSDADCSGGSDYDADGDGVDSAAHGGTDCDDTDASLIDDCGTPDSPLADYVLATTVEQIDEILMNLSGVTWNPVTETFLAVLDSNRTLVELDADMAVLREISLSNVTHADTEDIVYLGQDDDDRPAYAIVTEDGVVYTGPVPDDGGTELDLAGWQSITYRADDAGNHGGEGIAYDPDTQTFWVCEEKSPMGVATFARPTTDADVSHEDGSLLVTAAFDADALLAGYATDLASCLFDARTGRLLLLSQESEIVLDVATDGTVCGTLDIVEAGLSKPEGLALMAGGDMIVAGEPNQWARYTYSGRGHPGS